MGAAEKFAPEDMPATAEELAQLWGYSTDYWLRHIACKPTFPKRLSRRPATWIIGEVLEWRRNNRE